MIKSNSTFISKPSRPHSRLENNEYDIDELAEQLKKAQQLIKFCKDKLTKTEEELLKIQSDNS